MFASVQLRIARQIAKQTVRELIQGIALFSVLLHFVAWVCFSEGSWPMALFYETILHVVIGMFLVAIYRRVGATL